MAIWLTKILKRLLDSELSPRKIWKADISRVSPLLERMLDKALINMAMWSQYNNDDTRPDSKQCI